LKGRIELINKIQITHILIVGACIRLVWLLLVPIDPVSDSVMYLEFAKSISNGDGYAYPDGKLTAYWAVGTSAIYALIIKLFGLNMLVISIFNLLIGVMTIYFVWSIANQLLNEHKAKIAALIICFWPMLIQYTTIIGSELLFIFFLSLSLFIWLKESYNVYLKAVLFGLAIAITSYIRPVAVPLLIILPILMFFKDFNWREPLKLLVVSCLVAGVLFTPWSIRNTELNQEFVFLSTNFGTNLWMGNNPDSNGGYMPLPSLQYNSEKHRETLLKNKAITFIKDNPSDFILLSFKRVNITYSRETIGVVWNLKGLSSIGGDSAVFFLKAISSIYWLVVFLLAVISMLILLIGAFKKNIFSIEIVLLVFLGVIPVLVVGQDRYHAPIIPSVALLAANMISQFMNKYIKSKN